MNEQKTCATCKWWQANNECRRMPPIWVQPTSAYGFRGDVQDAWVAVWPKTHPADWCGEHTPIDSDGRLNKWGFKTPTEGA